MKNFKMVSTLEMFFAKLPKIFQLIYSKHDIKGNFTYFEELILIFYRANYYLTIQKYRYGMVSFSVMRSFEVM